MKVSKVECLPVHAGWRKNFVFVRVETDAGIVGWGEAYSQYDRDRAIAAQVEELGRYVVGRDPFQVRHILQIAFDDYAQRRGSLELYCATSGIEQALWDIIGKASRQPVYNLLGGPVRSRIRVYANGWSYKMQRPEDYARGAEAVLARGFTAMKFDPVPGPWRTFIPKEHIRRAVKVMRAMRDAVGPDVDLLLDIHRRLAPMHAIELARALAEFEPYWFEEPCQSENIEALAEVRRASPIPVVTGEALHTRADFRPGVPRPRRRHHQSRRLQLRRNSRAHVHRRDGGIRSRRGVAAQLQLDDAFALGHGACGGLHAQFHHHRILPAVRGDRPAAVSEPAQAGQRLHCFARRPGSRPGGRRGRGAGGEGKAIPGANLQNHR